MSAMHPPNHPWLGPPSARGVTLLELMISALIGTLIILAFSGIDAGRLYITNQVRADAGLHTELAYAMSHMLKRLERADRINIISNDPGNIQFRDPPTTLAGGLDGAANYEWSQYRYDGAIPGLIQFYDDTGGGCPAGNLLADNITAMIVTRDPTATNEISIEMTANDPVAGTTLTFRGEVLMRAAGHDLVVTGLSPAAPGPPAACS